MRHGESGRGQADLHPHDHVDRMTIDPRDPGPSNAAPGTAAPRDPGAPPGGAVPTGPEDDPAPDLPEAGRYPPPEAAADPSPTIAPGPGPVIVGVDGTPASRAALSWAVRTVATDGARIVAVAVWQEPVQTSAIAARGGHRRQADAERMLDDALRGAGAPDGVERVVERGRPGTVLAERSREARLLVLGNRRRGPLGSLGSAVQDCLRHASCPVVVVPDGGPDGRP
ncbi:Nucleotide-binding universal stress protein, UspA family [Pseudonocardia ammonioxydans]|uniref:Nucleotide-binding universal stress protein, UspA family n=1 Tax=Pseudonocardia ammonioxydans TaxID=260086 RepID=A0A1I5BGF5_PSUAM|nr:universal stress protein [Pseudonocardia ammonioxydans]SFN73814.1 Nucleotide-binding universal stress protein, UspA family [Pseudonocardia ammonioxydans]